MVETWILPMMILLAVAVLLLTPLVEAAGTFLRGAAFFCPFKRRDVSVEFVEQGTFGLGKRRDVRSCSAFPDPRRVTCGKRCLEFVANASKGSLEREGAIVR